MPFCLFISCNLQKKLKAMRRSGNKGELAANQCESLLEVIQRKGPMANEVFSKRTKNGEYRINNCVKYDLGHGYRLVTIKNGRSLFVPYIGTHDEIDMWLDRHRYDEFDADNPGYVSSKMVVTPNHSSERPNEAGQVDTLLEDPYEEQLLAKIDDNILKNIFPGLFQKQQN